MFLQRIKFKGELVISIDPIDYITMSLSDSWDSCHSIDDGCHKAGTLSYMTDKVTVISYIRGKEREYHNCRVNNKNWRMCVYIDTVNKSAIFTRQYPFDNELLNQATKEMITELFATTVKHSQEITKFMHDNNSNNLHYNDITHGYEGSMIYTDNFFFKGDIGNYPYCPVCGDDTIQESESITCDNCNGSKYHCCECGESLDEDNIYWVGDDCYCEDCFNKYYDTCCHCGDYIEKSESITCVDNDETYCKHCADRHLIYCEDCEEYYLERNMTLVNDCDKWVCDNCCSENYTCCEKCGDHFEYTVSYDGYEYCEKCYNNITKEDEELA
jgi:hypothetical protein